MSYIDTDNYGYSERDMEQNWAAEYAKIVTNELEEKHDEDVALLEAEINAVASDLAAGLSNAASDLASGLNNVRSELESELYDEKVYLEGSIERVASNVDANFEYYLNDMDELNNGLRYGTAIGNGTITTSKLDDSAVTASKLSDRAVTTSKLGDSAVTASKLGDSAVTASKLGDSAVTTSKLGDSAVTTSKLDNIAVTTAKIADGAVTTAKLDPDVLFILDRSRALNFDLEWEQKEMYTGGEVPSSIALSTKRFERQAKFYIHNPNGLTIRLAEFNPAGSGIKDLPESSVPIYEVTPSGSGGYFRIQYYKGTTTDDSDYDLVDTLSFYEVTDEYEAELNEKLLPSLSMFPTFGVIGDSYASGVVASGNDFQDKYPQSWGQILAKKTGTKCTNFSHTGLTTRTWLTDDKGLAKLQASPAQHIYYLCLGINDYNSFGAGGLGTASDIGTNTNSFYGKYSKIVEAIQTKAPNAKIIMFGCTKYRDEVAKISLIESYNEAIAAIAAHYGVPYIDQDDDYFFRSVWCAGQLYLGHPRTYTYASMANAFERLIRKCIYENYSYFADYQITTEHSDVYDDMAGNEVYNTAAPVKIGAWINDGTASDIYRKAFQIEYDGPVSAPIIEIGFEDIGLYLNTGDTVVTLDRKCVLKVNDVGEPNAGDIVPSYLQGNIDTGFVFDIGRMDPYIKTALNNYGGVLYGYIDYIYVPAQSSE